MFIIKFYNSSYIHHLYDVNTAADVILGLTGDTTEFDRSLAIMGNMRLGEVFFGGSYSIECKHENSI